MSDEEKDWMQSGWGLKYAMKDAFERGCPVVWGARTIWDRGQTPDLLWDRQSILTPPDIAGDERDRRLSALTKLINGNNYLMESWENIPEMLDGSDDEHLILLDNDDLLIEANPCASYGYLYVCVSPKEGKI